MTAATLAHAHQRATREIGGIDGDGPSVRGAFER